jgi:site-specific DNA-cytosine methylase
VHLLQKLHNSAPAAAALVLLLLLLLQAAMRKAGQADDCSACSSAVAAADKLAAADVDKLPLPGEVDLIVGGPPCQVGDHAEPMKGIASHQKKKSKRW